MPSSVTAVNDGSDASGWHYRPYGHRPEWIRVGIATGANPLAIQYAEWHTECTICGSWRDAYKEKP